VENTTTLGLSLNRTGVLTVEHVFKNDLQRVYE
jgi:hypothetical protein